MATIKYEIVELSPTRAEVISALRVDIDTTVTLSGIGKSDAEVILPGFEWNALLDAARDEWMRSGYAAPSKLPMPSPPAPKKCLVKGCTNMSDRGDFVGELCAPCHEMITTGLVRSGATFIHSMRDRLSKIANIAS